MKETVYLVEATAYDPAIAGTRVLSYATGRGCVIDSVYYEPRLKDPGQFKTSLFADGKTSGPSQLGFGEIRLVNNDGGLDALLTYGFDGRPLVIKKALMLGATVLSVVTLLACNAEQPTCDWTEVAIRIKDRSQAFNVPLQPNKYGGSNALPAGLDGSADIEGRPKPLLYGVCHNVTPVCVNTARLIYQVNDGAVASIPAVYDKGIALQAGADYTSQAAMESTAPAPGEYRVWPDGGYFRLGASPAGQVTADAVENDVPGYASNTAANVMVRILLGVAARSGQDAPAFSADDITALNAANSAEVGFYAATETNEAAALDAVAASVGAWYGFDSTGTLRFGRLEEPSGPPVATLGVDQVKSIERVASGDAGKGLPAWRINLTYDRNWSPAASGWGDTFALAAWSTVDFPVALYSKHVAYGNGLFVTVGDEGTDYATSTDGRTWTARSLPTGSYWCAFAYGGGKFVLLSESAALALVTTDGITWTSHSLPGIGTWVSLAYGNGTWVAVSRLTGALTSPDASTWTSRSFGTGNYVGGLAFGGGLFAVGIGPNVYTSPNGITWTARNMPALTDYVHIPEACLWPRLAYGTDRWVAIAPNGLLAISMEGVSWASAGYLPKQMLSPLAYAGGHFFGVGLNWMLFSVDGETWLSRSIDTTFGYSPALGYGDGIFVVFKNQSTDLEGYVFSPTDRATWLTLTDRTLSAEDAGVQTKHLLAIERSVDTLLVDQADAQDEADRLLALYGVDRDRLRVKAPRDALPADVLGQEILLILPRYGLQGGKPMIVIGTEDDYGTPNIYLDLWG